MCFIFYCLQWFGIKAKMKIFNGLCTSIKTWGTYGQPWQLCLGHILFLCFAYKHVSPFIISSGLVSMQRQKYLMGPELVSKHEGSTCLSSIFLTWTVLLGWGSLPPGSSHTAIHWNLTYTVDLVFIRLLSHSCSHKHHFQFLHNHYYLQQIHGMFMKFPEWI